MAEIKNLDKIARISRDLEHLELSSNCWWEWKLVSNQFGKQLTLFTKIKDTVPHDLAISLLGIYPTEICAHV